MRAGTKKALSEVAVLKMSPPKSGRREIADALAPGLVLRITERGVKTWSVIYKVPGEGGFTRQGRALRGRQHRYTLGQYPALGIADARHKARTFMEKVIEGVDPAPALRSAVETRFVNSVEAVSKRMIDFVKKDLESWYKVEQALRDHVWPTLGARPISDVSQVAIHQLLDDMVAKGKSGAAREVRKHLSRLMNYAVQRGLIHSSPLAHMQRLDLAYKPKERTLTDEELRAFWAVTGSMSYPDGPWLRLLLLTGKRPSEWIEARRSEIDIGAQHLVIPAERTKTRKRSHVVPLVGGAWAILQSLPKWEGDDPFLFSTRAGKVARDWGGKDTTKLNEAVRDFIRKARGDEKYEPKRFTPHDLRRTFKTQLARLGLPLDVRDALADHAQKGMERVYNHYGYLKEKREALVAYEAHLMGIVA